MRLKNCWLNKILKCCETQEDTFRERTAKAV